MILDEILKAAGWSPGSMLQAISPEKQDKPSPEKSKVKRNFCWNSPDVDKKLADFKSTPSISRSSVRNTIDLTDDNESDITNDLIHETKILSISGPSNNISSFKTAKEMAVTDLNRENYIDQENRQHNNGMITYVTPVSLDSLNLPLPNGWKLFEHQRDAIRSCISSRRTILAFDMGLGKTIIGLMWAKILSDSIDKCLTIVIAPCTLLETWRREALMIGYNCFSFESKRIVSNGNSVDQNKKKLLLLSWNNIPKFEAIQALFNIKYQSFLLICDEAHAMQSFISQRTQASLSLCLHPRCSGVILSTGTPMKNGRPANIYPLLVGIRHSMTQNKLNFEKRYCNAKKTRFCAWDISGASNLSELKVLIGASLIRKTKEECLDLPPLLRTRISLEITDENKEIYNQLTNAMKSSGGAKKLPTNKQANGNILTLLANLRQHVSLAKVSPAAAIIRERLQNNSGPIVVFVYFKDTAKRLYSSLSTSINPSTHSNSSSNSATNTAAMNQPLRCGVLTGDITEREERQRLVDKFQSGQLDVIICSYGVGATGLTLTKSSTVILLDRPWTPGDVMQAEDRVRRIGQLSSTIDSIWLVGFPIDEKLDKLLLAKDKNTKAVVANQYECRIQSERQQNHKDNTWFAESNRENNVDESSNITGGKNTSDLRSYFKKNQEPFSRQTGETNVETISVAGDGWNVVEDEDEHTTLQSSIMQAIIKDLLK